VEGHRDNREFLVVFLGMAGYAVTACDSIPQALKVVEDRQFDVYIIGDCLPHGCNLPLAVEIKAINPVAPVILYSALAFANDIERGLKAGAHAYITKPGNLDHLLATINCLLNRSDPGPTDSGRPRSYECSSEQSSRGIKPSSEGVIDVRLLDRTVRRRHSGTITQPAIWPRGMRGGAVGRG
jgi:DNA-binding response OmpR family regulator